jgi:hypothetical protein
MCWEHLDWDAPEDPDEWIDDDSVSESEASNDPGYYLSDVDTEDEELAGIIGKSAMVLVEVEEPPAVEEPPKIIEGSIPRPPFKDCTDELENMLLNPLPDVIPGKEEAACIRDEIEEDELFLEQVAGIPMRPAECFDYMMRVHARRGNPFAIAYMAEFQWAQFE